MNYLPEVVSVKACGPTSLRLIFDDGTRKRVNVERFLRGPVFRPLRDPAIFRQAFLEAGTVAWPNGADIAPETLYELPEEQALARSGRASKPRRRATRRR